MSGNSSFESKPHRRPVHLPLEAFDMYSNSGDPEIAMRVAHETAFALLARVRENPTPEVVARLTHYTDEHGIDAIAELWSRTSTQSLPGALWRIYLLRALIVQDSQGLSFAFQRGAGIVPSIDPVVAGAAQPAGPEDIRELADQILHGVFSGDFAVALERAAAFARVVAIGFTSLADDADTTDSVTPGRSADLTNRALRFNELGEVLGRCARLWHKGELD